MKGLQPSDIPRVDQIEACSQSDDGPDNGRVGESFVFARPQPCLLVGAFPETDSLAKPFVVFVADLEGFSADQSISRRPICSMIPDHRPVIIRVIENLGRQGRIPKASLIEYSPILPRT
jgi:hypothetical protein